MAVRVQIIKGLGVGESYVIQKKYTRIGSTSNSDLVIDAKEISETCIILEKIEYVDYVKIHCKQSNVVQSDGDLLLKGEEYLWKPGEILILAGCSWLTLETGNKNNFSQNNVPRTINQNEDIDETTDIEHEDESDIKIDNATILKIGVIALCAIGFIIIALTQVIFSPTNDHIHGMKTYVEIENFVNVEVSAGRLSQSIQQLLTNAYWKESWNPAESHKDYQKLQWLLRQKYEDKKGDISPEERDLLAFVNSKVLNYQR